MTDRILLSLVLSPHGKLYVERAGTEEALRKSELSLRLEEAFAAGSARGLFALAGAEATADLPSPFPYWRDLGRLFLTRVCGLPDGEDSVATLPPIPPPGEELQALALAAPAMKGGEYLTVEVLGVLWREMDSWLRSDLKGFRNNLKAYIAEEFPTWHTVGRVCFHLAENKRSEETPFAFLATYTTRLSDKLKAQHLPLGRALEIYGGEKDKSALLNLLIPIRSAAEKSDLVKELLESGDLYHPLVWTPSEAYRFLKDIPVFEASGVMIRVPDWWNARKPPRPEVSVRIGDKSPAALGADAMLDFSIGLTLGGEPLSAREYEELLSANEGLAFIRGKWVEIDAPKLKEVLAHWKTVQKAASREGVSFLEGMRLLSGVGGAAGDGAAIGADWSSVAAGRWLSECLERLKNPETLEAMDLDDVLKARLRPYQEEGVKWLRFLKSLGLGACLADDMGLGKTIQVIALFLILKKEKSHGKGAKRAPHLLVVPASLVANWKSEVERFAPSLSVFIAHQSVTPAAELKAFAPDSLAGNHDVALTTYGSLARFPWIAATAWDVVVLDEAQAIKNPNAKQTRAVKQLKSTHRIALTGTPVENRLSDLWSLFDFLSPGLLGSAKAFTDFSKKLSGEGGNAYLPLRALVRPYILRRLKTDRHIISDLPEKTEVRAFCALTKLQAALYQKSVESLAKELKQAEGIKRRGLILSYLMRFKQICNHPSQWLGDGAYVPSGSGKFARLAEICEEIAARQEKVLVFTQFRGITDVLSRFLEGVFGQPGLVLHGETAVAKRKPLVDRFQEELGPPFFILSLKAGGTGLNLTQASHVIHFDRWWNPAVENQATDRAFRIGQKKNVLVHKFVCRGTIEDRIDEMIESKRALSRGVLEGGSERLLTEMSNDELIDLVSLDMNRALEEA